ncbi:MAG: acyl-CoA dehydrogenase family protein, partial [Tsuneonella sp.]
MDFEPTDRQKHWRDRVRHFIDSHVRPRTDEYRAAHEADRWGINPVLEEEKARAKAQGIWNLFMPPQSGRPHVDDSFEFDGPGLTNLEYALCAEEMGRIGWASEVFNCSAPDTGNMEVFHRYGTREQKEEWLRPLMEGEIRSAFLMTEPQVASSDATNIETRMIRDGDHYVINGTKWWSSGAGDPRCKVAIVMGKTDFEAKRHQQQSQIIVPLDTLGVNIKRFLPVFGYDDSPHGHMEIELKDVRVPASNMILGEGRGFEIAQGRLGPGRIHHCMRALGVAERALELMVARAASRSTFGRPIAQHGVVQEWIAESRLAIEQARLLVLKTAWLIDPVGASQARTEIAAIKVAAPRAASYVLDRAVQVFGAAGVSSDTPLAEAWAQVRT